MIDISKILKRSWQILWSYRILWIFGLLLALTTGGSGGGGNSGSRYTPGDGDLPRSLTPGEMPTWARELTQWFEQNIEPLVRNPEQHIATFVLIGVAFILFVLVISVITAIVRYVSETAVMRMVDDYEQTGNKVGFRQGWKLGWSRRAFRMWVIDLIISLPAIVFIALMLMVGLVIYFSVTNTVRVIGVLGVVVAIGGAFLTLFIFIVLMVFLTLLRNFFARAAALDNLGVIESFRSGWQLFKGNWKSAALMWLVMVGISIGFGFAGIILFFLLIPLYLILLLPAAVVGFIPGIIAFGITSLFASGPLAWIIGILAALPFFFMVLFAPLFLISGWYKIYESNVWTLTYREIKTLANLSPQDAPVEIV